MQRYLISNLTKMNQNQFTKLNHVKLPVGLQKHGKSSHIFILSVDCFEEIFSWLSLDDVYMFGQTCTRLQQIAGQYFNRNYPAASVGCANNGIYINGLKMNGFSRFIQKISFLLYKIDDGRFPYIEINCSQWLRQIHLMFVNLNGTDSDSVRKVLSKIEVLEINHCTIYGDFYEKFLKLCPNVNRLYMRYSDSSSDILNLWLTQMYPKLEHLEWLKLEDETEIDLLPTFFKQNSNIRHFATTATFLWNQRDSFNMMDIDLDDLAIDMNFSTISYVDSVLNTLFELQQRSFYKRLHLYGMGLQINQQIIQQLAQLESLVKIYLRNFVGGISFLPLSSVKELAIYLCPVYNDLKPLAIDLINVERVYFWKAAPKHILPFIRHSKKLKKIKIQNLDDENGLGRILNLSKMNRVRGKLNGARKVTIYVKESTFLATKWATNNEEFEYVEIKQTESYHWEHHFGY